jgi:hypothetical protein
MYKNQEYKGLPVRIGIYSGTPVEDHLSKKTNLADKTMMFTACLP